MRVAEQAWVKLAREEAVDALERTIRLVDAVPSVPASMRSKVLLALGEAQHRAGLEESAMETFSAASLSSAGDVEVLARASIGFEDACMASGRERRSTGDPAIEMLEQTLGALRAGQEPLQARVQARLARARWFSGSADTARQLLDVLAQRPADRSDTETRLAVLLARRIVASPPADAEERLNIAAEVAALASDEGRYDVALDAIRTRVLTLVELGRLDDADDEIELFARRLERWHEPLFSPFSPIFRAMRDLQSGRFDDAALQLDRAGALAERTQSAIARQLITMQQYALARWSAPDTLNALIPRFEAFVGRTGSGTAWRHAVLLLLEETGCDEVVARLDRFERSNTGSWIERLPVHEFWSFSMGCLAPVLAVVGSDEERASAYDALLPLRSLLVGNVAPVTGPLEHSLGLLAEARGDHHAAVGHVAAAVRTSERLGALPWLVEALSAQARILRSRRMPGDEPTAAALDERASRIGRSIGMVAQPTLETSRALPASLAGLSSREREVLALLAAGKSNHEIAAELFISYRTVKTHVSHILDKLGTRDRTSAALLAHRAGL
jgi:ATP/maltotriose-dependent transcriptional regulator MalT